MSSSIPRRQFISAAPAFAFAQGRRQPNILWITCEDLSPILGCYGDRYASTPNLDRLATQGVRYSHAFSAASVCAPARSTLITGTFATSLGTQHLRGIQPLPAGVTCFPEYLRKAGYYCSNNEKQDYNFVAPPGAWDESSGTAHWRKRKAGQPFFSVFNIMATHQGQIRYSREQFEKLSASLKPEQRYDPARAPLPPYYPDTPVTRLNIAELYTQTTLMDARVGRILEELEADGLARDTIVFFFSDHGTGLPRGKRWLHDSGTRVPFIVRFPEPMASMAPGKPGAVESRMVSFVDFAPTVLTLAGVKPPASMQGGAFLGESPAKPRETVHFIRDRVDEVLEISRSARDRRYQYIRNYLPHRPRMQHSDYSELGLVRQELRRLHREEKLRGDEAWLMAPVKPAEELYDVQADPHQLRNLAGSPEHDIVLKRLRADMRAWMIRTRDTGLLPEPEMMARAGGGSPRDIRDFPIERILDAAELVGRGAGELEKLKRLSGDDDAVVRYWALVGLRALGAAAAPAEQEIMRALEDSSVSVRIAAAEAAFSLGDPAKARAVLEAEVVKEDSITALQAAIVFWYLGEKARGSIAALKKALEVKAGHAEQRQYVEWAVKKTLARLETPA
jgi:uncharacterized sulfatase